MEYNIFSLERNYLAQRVIVFLLPENEPLICKEGAGHVSTVAKNGQTKRWWSTGPFVFYNGG